MKTSHIIILLILLPFFCFSQQKDFDVIVGTGLYSTPARKPIKPAPYFSGEFEYQHNKWVFSAGIITAEYWFEKLNSSTSINGSPTTRGSELQSNFLIKYKLINKDFITIQAGAGAGLITMGREEEIKSATSFSILYASNTDLGFPLTIEAYSKITKHFFAGVKLGSFIFPDYPIIGNNFGIQMRYRL